MKQSLMLIVFVLAVAVAHAFAPAIAAEPQPGLSELRALGQINGQALACSQMVAAQRAKTMMLSHAPKAQAYGDAFIDGTNDGYLRQSQPGQACPTAEALGQQLNVLGATLAQVLPLAADTPTAFGQETGK